MDSSDHTHESKYWKSLRQYYDNNAADEDKAREFAKGVTDDFDIDAMPGMSRKHFLALLSASAAFAAAGCSNYRDKGDIIPYTKKPEEITLGTADHYASTCTGCQHACGILIKTREGRPIKVDGNPEHPVNKGKICVKGQGHILNLYDPERLQDPMIVESGILSKSSWKETDTKIIAALTAAVNQKKEIALIMHTVTSPSAKKVIDEFVAKYPTTKVYSYELVSGITRQNAWQKSTGSSTFPVIEWDKAKVIVTVESDILGYEGNMPEQTRMFAEKRDVMKGTNFNRLYSIDSTMSSTAMNADYRFRVRLDHQLEFLLALINEFKPMPQFSEFTLDACVKKNGLDAKAVHQLVSDLKEHKGEAIIHAGSGVPEAIHVAVNLLNDILGNSALYNDAQSAVDYVALSQPKEWESLVASMNAGTIGAVVHFDTNPVFHFVSDLGYKEALKKVPAVVTLCEEQNESSAESGFVLPIHHTFESWGDHKVRTGVYSLQQPVIAPLYRTRQKEAVLQIWTGGNPEAYKESLYHDYIMARWEKEVYPQLHMKVDFQTFWFSSLHDGVVTFDERSVAPARVKSDAASLIEKPNASNGYVVYLHESYFIGDGRFANNGWLQEMPHVASKITWDNYASLAPATAKELKVEEGDMVKVSIENRTLDLPVHIQPGLPEKCIPVMLGYGRTVIGTVGAGAGFNAIPLMSKSNGLSPWLYANASVTKTGESYLLASTEEHHSLDNTFVMESIKEREIVREGTLVQFIEDPHFIERERHIPTIVPKIQYPEVKWAMAIDLNKCTGCSVCTVACTSENNVPVVGKVQVNKGRDMTWIRIDRYFSGSAENPTVSNQPMLCQQCDNAPCENVCPVSATTHSPDGLNQMIYNRCVGTKYCSNNCPYKVRRFNFFNFRDDFDNRYQYEEPLNMLYNPEVTVRSRGVMEKCTFCVQRIMEERQHAIEQNRSVKGSNVVTACQEACPAEAIVFGDMNDKNSAVYKYREHQIGYRVLEEINVGPNVTYIARLRNVESETEKA